MTIPEAIAIMASIENLGHPYGRAPCGTVLNGWLIRGAGAVLQLLTACLVPRRQSDCVTVSGLPSCFAGGCVAALPSEGDGDRSPLLASGVVADEDDGDGLASTF